MADADGIVLAGEESRKPLTVEIREKATDSGWEAARELAVRVAVLEWALLEARCREAELVRRLAGAA